MLLRLVLVTLLLASVHVSAAVADAGARAPVAGRPAVAVAGAFTALCYHEVRDDVRDYPDPYAVDAAALVTQFAWLRGNGYTPVSLDDIVAARAGGQPLPAKAVLLTFDDAYRSFYTRVYPLLLEFRFPAVLGVVGKWIDNPDGAPVMYGEKGTVPEASFPTWSQLREMAASGLVELASHSYDLHRGVPANPQGNLQPAATARVYDAATGGYEGDAGWRARVREDLARNAQLIERETGRRPRAVVWPYGNYNDELVRMAGELGMPVALTLDDGVNAPGVPLTAVRRTLVQHNPTLAEFAYRVRGPLYPEPVRVVQLDLGSVYDADPAQQERNLSALLDRIQVLQPTHVFLQAGADLDNDGIADAAWFPNRHLPLRADLFNRVAWQLASRNGVKVFAVLPVAGLRLTQAEVVQVYEDLARHASFDGLLFMQDGGELTRQIAEAARRWRSPLLIAHGVAGGAPGAADNRPDHLVVAMPPEAGVAGGGDAKFVRILGKGNSRSMASRMRGFQLGGALNFGYSGENAAQDDPPLVHIPPAMSLRIHPR